jgi:hypothetical protein
MHDPQTVAFDIKAPWFKRWPNGERYHPTILTIWHVDPEKGGSDDSCGRSYVRASPELRDKARKLGEQDQVFITGEHGYAMQPSELVMEVWQTIGARIFNRHRRGGVGLTHRELLYVLNLANNPGDNLRHSCSKAGSPEGMGSLFVTVLRCYMTFHRRWWQHPKWHVHHWRFQVQWVQQFKRWAFSRCATCGGRFSFGYCPTTNTWSAGGP